jgi:hypothetical protein
MQTLTLFDGQGENAWEWAKILSAGADADSEDSICFAYARDRIAVSFPRVGVKVWIWSKGTPSLAPFARPCVVCLPFAEM